MKSTFTKVMFALVAMISLAGCPSKKNNNGNFAYGAGYNYGGVYCQQVGGCYGQPGYGQMFATGLGKIQSSHLFAEVALNFSTSTQVNNFAMTNYNGNTQMVGTLNVYSSSQFCPIAPGQYQVYGNGTFGSGAASHSFAGTVTGGSIAIAFQSNWLTMITSTSVMGPSFPFAVQGYVTVMSPYGSCGQFVME